MSDILKLTQVGQWISHIKQGSSYLVVGRGLGDGSDMHDMQLAFFWAAIGVHRGYPNVGASPAALVEPEAMLFQIPLRLQLSDRKAFRPEQQWIVYQAVADQSIWARPITEFATRFVLDRGLT